MSELKPCPFCGGKAEMIRQGTHRASMQIGCTYCGALVESGDVFGLTPIETWKWNTRHNGLSEERLAEMLHNAGLNAHTHPQSKSAFDWNVYRKKLAHAIFQEIEGGGR